MGVTMRRVEPTPDLQAILAQAVHMHVNDAEYMAELAMWSGRHARADGVPARSTRNPQPAARVPCRVFAGAALAPSPDINVAEDTASYWRWEPSRTIRGRDRARARRPVCCC